MAQYKPRTEFAVALAQIASERGVAPEVVMETIKMAILAAYRRDARERGEVVPEEEALKVQMNPETGEARILLGKEDVTPPGFTRIAAQTAKQVILQKIREAEKSAMIEEYSKRVGALVSGMILRFDGPNMIVDIGKTEAVMPPGEQVRSENYRLGQRLTFYLEGIKEGPHGQQIVVSRAQEGLVKELFRREVPEVSNGAVEIKVIAREPGVRTKAAVSSNRVGIDPVGSCVGQKGVRVIEVINELFGEKIDIIPYEEEPEKFIKAALSPAEGTEVKVDEKKKTAQVRVPEDQLSLAIGKEGQNVRLASRLTGFKIDIVGKREEEKESKSKAKTKSKTKKKEEKSPQGEKVQAES